MKIKLIRNATLKITVQGHTFLIDPYLAPKHSQPTFAGISPNPTVELPMPAAEVLAGVEMILVSHLHPDHFDETAIGLIPKDMLIYCQPADLESIQSFGFSRVLPLAGALNWQGITIIRTKGQHGTGERLKMMGEVSGYVLKHPTEPTVYWCGDTILNQQVETVITQYEPDVIVTHSGGAIWGPGEDAVIMDAHQTIAVSKLAPESTIIATHLEALDLTTVSREKLSAHATEAGVADRLLIPQDGEEILLNKPVHREKHILFEN